MSRAVRRRRRRRHEDPRASSPTTRARSSPRPGELDARRPPTHPGVVVADTVADARSRTSTAPRAATSVVAPARRRACPGCSRSTAWSPSRRTCRARRARTCGEVLAARLAGRRRGPRERRGRRGGRRAPPRRGARGRRLRARDARHGHRGRGGVGRPARCGATRASRARSATSSSTRPGRGARAGKRGLLGALRLGGRASRGSRARRRSRGGSARSWRRSGDAEAVRGEDVTHAAAAGDPEALAVLDEVGWWLALGLANLAAILDPQLLRPRRRARRGERRCSCRRRAATCVGLLEGGRAAPRDRRSSPPSSGPAPARSAQRSLAAAPECGSASCSRRSAPRRADALSTAADVPRDAGPRRRLRLRPRLADGLARPPGDRAVRGARRGRDARSRSLVVGPLVARIGLVADDVLLAPVPRAARRGGRTASSSRSARATELSRAENLAYGIGYRDPDDRRASLRGRRGAPSHDEGVEVWIGDGAAATRAVATDVGCTLNLWDADAAGGRRGGGLDATVSWAGPAPGADGAVDEATTASCSSPWPRRGRRGRCSRPRCPSSCSRSSGAERCGTVFNRSVDKRRRPRYRIQRVG